VPLKWYIKGKEGGMINRIAYVGSEFTIEWFVDSRGRSQPLEYFLEQPKESQRKILQLFRLMGDQGKIFDKTKFRYEADGIYAFKPLLKIYTNLYIHIDTLA
jgi:hypothetical protein